MLATIKDDQFIHLHLVYTAWWMASLMVFHASHQLNNLKLVQLNNLSIHSTNQRTLATLLIAHLWYLTQHSFNDSCWSCHDVSLFLVLNTAPPCSDCISSFFLKRQHIFLCKLIRNFLIYGWCFLNFDGLDGLLGWESALKLMCFFFFF